MSWVIQLPFGFQSPPTLSDLQSVLQDAYSPPPLMTCCGSQSKPVMSPLRLHRNVKFYSTDLKLLCVVLKTKRHACLSSRILSFHKGSEPQLIDTFFMCFFPFFSQLGLFQRCERSCCVITINSISCVLSTDWALSLSLSLLSRWADIIPRTWSVWSQQATLNTNMEKTFTSEQYVLRLLHVYTYQVYIHPTRMRPFSFRTSFLSASACYLSNVVSIVQHVPFF